MATTFRQVTRRRPRFCPRLSIASAGDSLPYVGDRLRHVQDFSAFHNPVGTIFSPQLNSDPGCFRLSEDQVNFFHEHGYVTGVPVLIDGQVDFLRKELADLTDPNHPGHELFYEYHSNESQAADHILFHALGAWRITPGFHDVLWNPAIAIPASQLLGGPVRFWHDQLFCKPAHHGGVVAWHQDYSYWTRTQPLTSDVLDRPRRFHPRQRMPPLHSGKPPLARFAYHGIGGRYGGYLCSVEC